MNLLGSIGKGVRRKAGSVRDLVAVTATVLAVSVRRRTWSRTVRNVLARQILFTGFNAVGFISVLAFLVGISIVVQAQVWLTRVGQSALLGPVLVMVVVREVAPLLVNFVVIGRSGTAMAIELGNMNVSGEVRVLDAMGLDPFVYLVIPRVLGMALSVFCLAIVFVVVSFISGYLFGALMGAHTGHPAVFVSSVFRSVRPADVVNLLSKTLVSGLLTGAICCMEGLSVERAVTEVPQATTRAVVRSIGALFIVSAIVSVVTYL